MADEHIFLDGSGEPVFSKDGRSSFLAPGMKAEIAVFSGEGDTFHERFASSRNIQDIGAKMLFDALRENECRVKKTIIIKVNENADHGEGDSPPKYIRFRSAGSPGMGSFIRVVHEKGHVTWHLPLNKIWSAAASHTFNAGIWEFDIPHVEPTEGENGVFSFVGHKVITEVAFAFLEYGVEELLKHAAAAREKHRGLGLKEILPSKPAGPFLDFEVPENLGKSKRVLLLLHGTFSSIDGCFGELLRDKFFLQMSKRYEHVLGLEHDTLSVTPQDNAEVLRNTFWPRSNRRKYIIDILSHSRGGLVARCFTEYRPRFISGYDRLIEHVVMLGTPNSGTPIARNMMSMINSVSNATGYITDDGLRIFLYTVISAIKLLGNGVEQLPGISVQAPGSQFLRSLNSPEDGRGTQYSIASSNFIPRMYLARLLKAAYGYALFNGVPNDMVVPCASVAACVPTQAFAHTLQYTGSEIHHCSFFRNPKTKAFLKQALM